MSTAGRIYVEGVPSSASRERLELFFTKVTQGADINHVYFPLPLKPQTAVVEFTDKLVVDLILQDTQHGYRYIQYKEGDQSDPIRLSAYEGPENPLLSLELDSFAISGMEINSQDDIDRITEIMQKPFVHFSREMKFLNLEEVISKEAKDENLTPSKMATVNNDSTVKLDFSGLHKVLYDKMVQCKVSKVHKMFFPTDVKYCIPDTAFDAEEVARLYQRSPGYGVLTQSKERYQSHVIDMLNDLSDELVGRMSMLHLTHKTTFQDLYSILTKIKTVRDKTLLNGPQLIHVQSLDFYSKVVQLPILNNVIIYTRKPNITFIQSSMDGQLKDNEMATNLFQAGLRIHIKGVSKILSQCVITDVSQLKPEDAKLISEVATEKMSVTQNLNTPPASPASTTVMFKSHFAYEEWHGLRRYSSFDVARIAEKRKRQRAGLSDAYTSISDNVFVNYSLKFAGIAKCLDAINKIQANDVLQVTDITVGLLDTGVSMFHKAFSPDQILAVQNFVKGDSLDAMWDVNGQGTHCCGILAGGAYAAQVPSNAQIIDEPLKFVNGVAPFAKLVMAKVLDRSTYSSSESLAEGIEWMLQLEEHDPLYKVDIISISAGDMQYCHRLRAAVSMATVKGKVVICASSNDEESHQTGIVYPARFADVICVGSHNARGQVSRFTPLGREMDFLGPGDDIWSAAPGSSTAVQRLSGTAMSAPFVAGVAALVLRYAEAVGGESLRKLACNNAVMREILRVMSSSPGHHSEAYGYGSVNPWRVFEFGTDYFKNLVTKIVYGEVQM